MSYRTFNASYAWNPMLVHTPRYDFNDDILTLGAAYRVRLVESALDRPGPGTSTPTNRKAVLS
jgi:hypothetical protein